MKRDLTILSLGAGLQSTTVALLAERGEIPKPDVGIFADLLAEPPWVYDHLDWLEAEVSFPIERITTGDLESDVLVGTGPSHKARFSAIPAYVKQDNGKRSLMRRQCTKEYKVIPIDQAIRRRLGLAKGERAAGRFSVEKWLGISLDEVARIKPPRSAWIDNAYPLIDLRMRRGDCSKWLAANGYPEPKKSSCWFCPFHSNDFWKDAKENHPELWERIVAFDERIRRGVFTQDDAEAFLHNSLVPLKDVDFSSHGQRDLFTNECEGYCGV